MMFTHKSHSQSALISSLLILSLSACAKPSSETASARTQTKKNDTTRSEVQDLPAPSLASNTEFDSQPYPSENTPSLPLKEQAESSKSDTPNPIPPQSVYPQSHSENTPTFNTPSTTPLDTRFFSPLSGAESTYADHETNLKRAGSGLIMNPERNSSGHEDEDEPGICDSNSKTDDACEDLLLHLEAVMEEGFQLGVTPSDEAPPLLIHSLLDQVAESSCFTPQSWCESQGESDSPTPSELDKENSRSANRLNCQTPQPRKTPIKSPLSPLKKLNKEIKHLECEWDKHYHIYKMNRLVIEEARVIFPSLFARELFQHHNFNYREIDSIFKRDIQSESRLDTSSSVPFQLKKSFELQANPTLKKKMEDYTRRRSLLNAQVVLFKRANRELSPLHTKIKSYHSDLYTNIITRLQTHTRNPKTPWKPLSTT